MARREASHTNAQPLSPASFAETDEQHDFPPASGPQSTYPYPNRIARLDRALQSTTDLIQELGNSVSTLSDQVMPPDHRARRRRHSLVENEDLPAGLQQSSALLTSTRHAGRTLPPPPFPVHTTGYMSPVPLSEWAGPSYHNSSTRRARYFDRRQWLGNASEEGEVGHDDLLRLRQTSEEAGNMAQRAADLHRAVKRRRIDGPNLNLRAHPPFIYGQYGQVEPGPLKMEILTCDGGELADHRNLQVYLGPENVLKTNQSVYCSSIASINMLMRHADTTPFCIDKIHIVGPEHGFDAPVSQGVMYVAMNLEDLKQYQDPPLHAQLSQKNPLHRMRQRVMMRRHCSRLEDRLSLSEALRDPEIAAYYYDQSLGAQTTTATPSPKDKSIDDTAEELVASAARSTLRRQWERRKDNETPLMPHNAATTHTFDEHLDDDADTPSEFIEYRNNRQHTRSRIQTNARIDAYIHSASSARNMVSDVGTAHGEPHSKIEPAEHSDLTEQGGNDNLKNRLLPYEDPNVTFVPFYIEEGKSRIAIKFEPQVSARYILLQLSSELGKDNVDVQRVVISGFAGPRFFPAKEVR